jgi:large subunit ribosomal protein L10
MSKYVKDLLTDEIRRRLDGVDAVLLVSLVGVDAQRNFLLRRELRGKGIHLMVVKNSLARRATEGTALAAGFEGLAGMSAVVWGGKDVVSLAKEVVRLAQDKKFAPLAASGGVLDGARLSADEVQAVSKWPTREEQLSLLCGQILSPGRRLASQLIAAGGALASQIEKLSQEKDSTDAAPA